MAKRKRERVTPGIEPTERHKNGSNMWINIMLNSLENAE
jgi:hypothetical protein